jgi:glyoxylase-like metal-dependent hydrolase (beta-lactamase superfamily II)
MWDEVSDGIFRRKYSFLQQNIGAIVTDEGLVVVDSRSHLRHGEELVEELRRLSKLPVRWLINTHYHWDHTFGNAAFPDATIIGHDRCRAALIEEGDEMRRQLASADWIPHQDRDLISEVAIVLPGVTFDATFTIHSSSHRIDLAFLGRGHTDSDIVVLCDDVCFAGDLVEESDPPSFGDSYPRAWLETLSRLRRLVGERRVVPGHGEPVDGRFIDSQRDEIRVAIEVATGNPGFSRYPAGVIATIRDRLVIEAG